MLRITTHTADDELLLKLEGLLAGPWVGALEACWRDAGETLHGRRVRIDLTAVCTVDAAGRDLLTVMYRAGARFVTGGCVMPEVVREISECAGSGVPARTSAARTGSADAHGTGPQPVRTRTDQRS